ncbi:hypothetical protein [Brevifollis gellanilyticus]|nr:hypothetical protein [Brevifollis gellanilyticus]
MNTLQKVPAWFWMLLSYAALAVPFLWAGNQPASTASTSVFMGCLLVCWIPAFVFVNRRDIQEHRVFWISQAVSLLAAAAVFGIVMAVSMHFQDLNARDARTDGSTPAVVATIIAYLISNNICVSLVTRTRATVEASVEKKLSPSKKR